MATALAGLSAPLWAKKEKPSWKIGITDWNANAKGKLEAFKVAKEYGLDGVQFSYVPDEDQNLTDPEVQQQVLAESRKQGVAIASLGMGVYNGKPFATHPDAVEWADQCLDIMAALKKMEVYPYP